MLGIPPCRVSLDDEDFTRLRIRESAVCEFAGQSTRIQRRLAPGQIARLARRLARLTCRDDLLDNTPGCRGILLEEFRQCFADGRFDNSLNIRIAQFGLRLPLKLRIRNAHGDDGGQALARVFALNCKVDILQQVVLGAIVVDRTSERGFEPDKMRAAFNRIDVVHIREDVLLVRVVVLHRHFDVDAIAVTFDIHRFFEQRRLVLIEILDKRGEPAFVLEDGFLIGGFFRQFDADAAVEECQFPQTRRQDIEGELRLAEDFRIGLEGGLRAGLCRFSGLLHRPGRVAAAIRLPPHCAIAHHFDRALDRKRVDHRNAHTVQAAGDFVRLVIKLAARMQYGHDHFQRRLLLRRMHVHRNAASVVDYLNRAVGLKRHLDVIAESGHRLVNRVVDHLVNEMMQPARTDIADVHRRTATNRLKTFEDGDVFGGVITAVGFGYF